MQSSSSAGPIPVVVITGASAGLGRATALAFARRGWRVALIARGQARLESAAAEVGAAGGEALVLPADVADASAVFAAADRVNDAWGRIDIWINNAMASVFSPIAEMTPEEFRRVTEVTYLGQVHGTLAALRHMQHRDQGTIVQIGSALSYRSIPLQSAYCAAKFAVRGFTDSLRSELIHDGSAIRLTMVQLPAVNTPQFDWARSRLPRRLQPVPPIYAPEAVAEAVVRAALEAPRELWVGRPAMEAILGTMAAPAWLDRMMASRAWDGQMTPEPATPHQGNLTEAPPGDPRSEGRFTSRARARVLSASETTVRGGLVALGLGLFGSALALAWRLGASNAHGPSRRIAARDGSAPRLR
jgi:NAD(P)-dependent dehydrogenase (short-subunit alcohol dehydrogenase family)